VTKRSTSKTTASGRKVRGGTNSVIIVHTPLAKAERNEITRACEKLSDATTVQVIELVERVRNDYRGWRELDKQVPTAGEVETALRSVGALAEELAQTIEALPATARALLNDQYLRSGRLTTNAVSDVVRGFTSDALHASNHAALIPRQRAKSGAKMNAVAHLRDGFETLGIGFAKSSRLTLASLHVVTGEAWSRQNVQQYLSEIDSILSERRAARIAGQ